MIHPLSLVKTDASPPPLAFGPYGVEGVLGRGSMGLVYRARHQTLGRPVAIKCLHESLLSDDMLVRRFLQEARLVNAINHPHIVEVHDFVESPGQVYAVMELLEGETLTARLERQALPLDHLVRIATQLGEALKAAHDLSVVHRDLKPDNVFLCQRDGRDWVKVLDFGVAKLVSAEGPRVIETQNGDVLGTPRYMAPEQASTSTRGPTCMRSERCSSKCSPAGPRSSRPCTGSWPPTSSRFRRRRSPRRPEPESPCPRGCGASSSRAWRRCQTNARPRWVTSSPGWRTSTRCSRSRVRHHRCRAGWSPLP
jgi:serine/threonine protein kinase